jgi:hypothetical protein
MLMKRVFLTLLITGVIATLAAATQAQSTDMKLCPRSTSVNNPVPAAPDQVAESAVASELQIAPQESKKNAIVGTWLGTLGNGHKFLITFHADGTINDSTQGDVSTNPGHQVHTPKHGVWEHLGGPQFGFVRWGLVYDLNTGELISYTKIRAVLTIDGTGDEISGSGQAEVLDPNGNVVMTTPPGSFTYKRIKFEPLN